MATKRGERVDYKSLHNLTLLDLTSTTKNRKRYPVHQANIYAIERLTSKRETCERAAVTLELKKRAKQTNSSNHGYMKAI